MSSFRLFTVVVCVFWGVWGQRAWASDNGNLKLELQDPVAVGMGGAFVGESDRPSAVYYDPAGIVQMDSPEVTAGMTWVQPQVHYESSAVQNGTGYTANEKEDNYIFPDVFVTTPVPLMKDKLYIGLGESSNFGGGQDWEANSFSRYDTVKDSMTAMDYSLVAAYKVTDQWSLGGGFINDQSKFEHDVALFQSGGTDGDGLFKASDNAWGFNLSTMFKLNEQNQFGLDYKSPIHHQYSGNFYMNGLSTAGNDYEGIFGGTTFQTKAIQKFTMPQSVTLGYSAKPINKLTLNFDLEWTDWAQYKNQTTYYPNLSNAGETEVLSTGNPQARDWHSVWSESVGAQYAVMDTLRLRVGYEHHQTPIPENTFDTEFPDSDSNAVTFGIGYDITSRLTIDVAYVADFYESRNVVNTVDNSIGVFMNGKYSAFANVGTVSLTYKF